MQVTIIGSGNVATVMGRVLRSGGHTIRQVYSRQEAHAKALAAELGAQPVTDLTDVDAHADLYLLAVTDDALPSVAERLSLGDRLVVHTAGSVTKGVLAGASTRYGVVWPVKMVRKQAATLAPVTIVMDGSDAAVTEEIRAFAHLLSPTVVVADDAQRLKMHMVASFTLNFTNHLYHLAADYCAAEGIDFQLFQPLILESVQRLAAAHPRDLQAGPAFRGDTATIQKHLALLEPYPAATKIYQVITQSIQAVFARDTPGSSEK